MEKVNATLIGTWRLVSFEETLPYGQRVYPYGRDPLGMLIYTDAGYMCVQIMRRDRRPLPNVVFEEMSPDEVKQAVGGFTGFCGTYSVDSSNMVVVHHVECHVLPGSVGKDLRRTYDLEGDRLVLRPSPNRSVTWERVK
jgi:hypothetical protein